MFPGKAGPRVAYVLMHPHRVTEHKLFFKGQAEPIPNEQDDIIPMTAVQTKALVDQAGYQARHHLPLAYRQDCQTGQQY